MGTTKICSKCKIDKLLDEFSIDNRVPSGKQSECKVCQKERNISSGWLAQRKYRLRKEYNLSIEEYDTMYDYQNGNCAGCFDSIKKINRATHIDHDHKTGLVRGILCQSCNTVLGYAKDDTHRLQGLIHYLEYKK